MFFGLLSDVDLLMSVVGRADDLDDRNGCSSDEVNRLDLITHRFQNVLDLP